MTILWRKVVRDLLRRRARTGLTLLGIVLGVAGLVAVSATARQLGVAQREAVAAVGAADLAVRTETLAVPSAAWVARATEAEVVEARVVVEASFSVGEAWRGSTLIGLGDGPGVGRPELVAGRWPGASEVAFDAGVTALTRVGIGDLVAFRRSAGERIAYLTVSGTTRTPTAVDAGILNRVNAYAKPDAVEAVVGERGTNQLLVALAAGADAHTAGEALGRALDRRGIAHGPVAGPDAGLVGERELRTVVWLLLAFSTIGLVLSASLVANTVAAVVQDEYGQIGVLKALGGSRGRVAAVYLLPALTLGLVGTTVGYGVGVGGGQAIVAYLTGLLGYRTPPVAVTGRELGFAAIVGLGVPCLAAAGPAVLGARMPVVTLLRHYGLAAMGSRGGGPLPRAVGRWSPLGAMALRNAPRRRMRAGVTVGLIGVAVAAAMGAGALSASLDGTVATLYARYGADAWVAFGTPANEEMARAVEGTPGVTEAEGWARTTGFASGEAIDLWGVPGGTTVYDHRMLTGRWLGAGEGGREAVASGRLARRLGVGPGDAIALGIGNQTRVVRIVGVVDDESTYLGSTAAGKLFLTPTTLGSFANEEAFTFLAVEFERHDPAGVEAALTGLEERFATEEPRSYAAYSDKASTARTIAVLTTLLRAMVALVGIIGLVGVVNTLAMNVAERRREVGVLRALGGRRRHLATLLATEGMAFGAAGWALGVALGFPLGWVLVRLTGNVLFRLSFELPPSFLLLTLVATVGACALASVGPALAAAGVRPVSVLRYE